MLTMTKLASLILTVFPLLTTTTCAFSLLDSKLGFQIRRLGSSRPLFVSTSNEEATSVATSMESVVRRYFEGVNRKDPDMIRSCFADQAVIRDVCGINDSKRAVQAQDLVDRCMDFLTAHPDTQVDFHYGPEKGRDSQWVVAHWYETGTWSGESCNLAPTNQPMKVEGQTRFLVNDELKIEELVVTRTFTEWENAFVQQQQKEAKESSASSSSESSLTPGIEPDAWKELSMDDLNSMLETAEAAARAAGKIITSNIGCCSEDAEECEIKTSIKDIVTEHDMKAQKAVEDIIRSKYPEHSFLGEEDVDPGAAASEAALTAALAASPSGFIWICDPIDGTANFASGLSLCAVTMGLVYKGVPLVGVVYDPHSDEMFTAIKGQGAFLNKERLHVAHAVDTIDDAVINAGCPADPNAFEASMRGMMALNGVSRGLRVIACSALTTAWIAAGRLTAHFGYDLSSWDLVAGALLIHEAGGLVTDLDGSPYTLETRNMLCSNGHVHDDVLSVLREADAVSFERAKL